MSYSESHSYTDADLRRVLRTTKVIACVGMSPNQLRPSNFVGRYLKQKGFRVIAINPGHAGKELFGEPVYARLSEIPDSIPVDMVDIFRKSIDVPPIVEEALEHLPALRTIWMQIGVENAEARARAEAAGKFVIEDLCPKMEHQRLYGELRKAGFNTGVISSKL